MAMPVSGCIALRTCVTGINCSSISCAVNGSAAGTCCLSALSVTAGKAAPHGMREFYGYTSAAGNAVSITNVSSTGTNGVSTAVCNCSCLSYSLTRTVGQCYCPAFDYSIIKLASQGIANKCAFVCILCNGTCIYGCGYNGIGTFNVSGTFAARCVDYNDTINIITCASINVDDTAAANASITISSITAGVGTYCIGTPSSIYRYTCGILV